MRPRSTASSQPPTWAIVALVTLAHLALAWGLVHWTAAPNPAAPPALSVQWVAELTPLQATPAPPDKRPGPLPTAVPKAAPIAKTPPTALATTPATAKAPPAAQAPSALPLAAPANSLAVANAPNLTSVNPLAPANNPPATGQPSQAAAPPLASTLGTATPGGVALSSPATSPRFDAAYLHNPKPNYPTRSRQLGETGTVVLKVKVEANGQPSQVSLSKSSGYERLDAAALESVKQWRFVAAQEGHQAVGAWVLVPVPFGLQP